MVGSDVVDSVGGGLARVDDDVGYQGAVEEGFEAEIFVCVGGADDGRTEIGVGVADLYDGRTVAVDGDGGRRFAKKTSISRASLLWSSL